MITKPIRTLLYLFIPLFALKAHASQIVNPATNSVPLNITVTTVTWSNGATTSGVNGSSVTWAGNIAFSSTSLYGIVGSSVPDNALAGNVGEFVSSVVGATSLTTSGHYGDITTISLTPGDWDVTAFGVFSLNGGTSTGNAFIFLSTLSGDDGTEVNTTLQTVLVTTGQANGTLAFTYSIPSYRFELRTTTTYRLKAAGNYTGGPPTVSGRLTARRIR